MSLCVWLISWLSYRALDEKMHRCMQVQDPDESMIVTQGNLIILVLSLCELFELAPRISSSS